ncbi:MAG: peptidase domain-containing ABC transporter [Pseudomonadota bacterium]
MILGRLKRRHILPVMRQTEVAECGLACIGMVSAYHGSRESLGRMRAVHNISTRGMTLADIKRVADAKHLACRAVKLPLSALRKLRLPAILHWDYSHFVVLKSVGRSSVILHDPAVGIREIPFAELAKHFFGVALEFTPTPDFKPGEVTKSAGLLKWISGFHDTKSSLLHVIGISLAIELLANCVPLFSQVILDDVIVTADLNLLTVLLIGYLTLGMMRVIADSARSLIVTRFGFALNFALQVGVFRHLINLPVSYFERRHTGDVISRFHAVHQIQGVFTGSSVSAFLDGIMVCFALVLMFLYSPQLSAISCVAVLLYAALRWLRYAPTKAIAEQSAVETAKLDSHVLETIQGIRGIQLNGRHLQRQESWMNQATEVFSLASSLALVDIRFGALSAAISSVESGLVLFLGAKQVIDGTLTVGMLIAFIAYKSQFIGRADAFINNIIGFFMVRVQTERLADILDTPLESDLSLTREVFPKPCPPIAVDIKNMSFQYASGNQWVVRGFSLSVAPGEHVMLIGSSGVGKTTVMKLLLGIVTPQEGEILYAGHRLGTAKTEIRSLIGAVMQDDILYSGSIAENITFFDESPDLGWAQECARQAEIHDDILAMGMAYHTQIGEHGNSLSGGQKQRILIARALYKRPSVLLLDEATSSLDIRLEERIAANIRRLNITRISISHRPHTIASADRFVEIRCSNESTDEPEKVAAMTGAV